MSDTQEETWLRAGEYVLGVMEADELAQVRLDAETDGVLANAVAFWEHRLAPLAGFVVPVAPPAWLYERIEKLLADRVRPAAPATAEIIPFKPRNTLPLWRGTAIASMAIAASLVVVLLRNQPAPPAPAPAAPPPERFAVILPQPTEAAGTGWLARVRADGSVRVSALGKIGLPADSYLELWAVPKGGSPIALGKVASAATGAQFSVGLHPENVAALAVSQEPNDKPLNGPTNIRYVGALTD